MVRSAAGEVGSALVVPEEELIRASLAAEDPTVLPPAAVVARRPEADRALVHPDFDLVFLTDDAVHGDEAWIRGGSIACGL